jgi:putative tricarboxylic transport membrane protein
VKKGELIVGTVISVIGIWVAIDSYAMGLQTISNPGPGFLPFVLGILLFALAIPICIRSLEPRMVTAKKDTSVKNLSILIKITIVVASLSGYLVALDTVGFPITAFLFLFILFWMGYPRKWLFISGMSIALVAFAWVIFGHLLQTPFPMGFLGGK